MALVLTGSLSGGQHAHGPLRYGRSYRRTLCYSRRGASSARSRVCAGNADPVHDHCGSRARRWAPSIRHLLQFRAAAWVIAWAGAVLGLLATWIFLSVLAAVTGDTERQPALLAMPVFGAASAGILQLALRNVPGARMEPGLPFLAGELVLLTYYCPALWRIAGLAWRCARRMEVRHIKAGMWVVSWAAAADFALVMLRLSAIVERASGIQIARPEITAMNAVQAGPGHSPHRRRHHQRMGPRLGGSLPPMPALVHLLAVAASVG